MNRLKDMLKFMKTGLLFLGFSGIIVQLLFIKEFLSLFNGNELILAIVIFNWMILTGLGAFLGKINPNSEIQIPFYSDLFLLTGTIPFISFFLLSYLKNIVFPPGSTASILQLFTYSLFLLAPYCLLSGFLFISCTVGYSKSTTGNKISHSYAIESIGSILGGIVFSFLIVYFLSTYQALGIIFFCTGLIAIRFRYRTKKKHSLIFVVILTILFPALCFLLNIDLRLKQFVYPNQKIIKISDSPYGSIVETSQDSQLNVYGNGILLFSSNNIIHDEELVHYAMVQHKNPKNILVVSGGTPGIFKEILKYNVDKIVYTEINPDIIKLLKSSGTYAGNKKIETINKDARQYIRQTPERFDVILINLPPPENFQINRYYSSEFMQLLKRVVTPNAIVRYCLPPTINYVSNEAEGVHSVLYNTLKQKFKNVLIIPGEFNYFIASDAGLSLNIAKLIQEKQIKNKYVNQYYVDDLDIQARSSYIMSRLGNSHLINSDLQPVSYFKQILYRVSLFPSNYRIAVFILAVVLIFVLSRVHTITLGVFIAGFTVSSVEILVLMSFQVFFGYIYLVTGIFFAIFMTGLSMGSLCSIKKIFKKEIHNFLMYQSGIAFTVLALLFYILVFRNYYNAVLIHIFTAILIFSAGFFMGRLFSSATRLQNKSVVEISADTYGFDLIGSALGAMLLASCMLPLLGFIHSTIVLLLINLLSAGYVWLRKSSV